MSFSRTALARQVSKQADKGASKKLAKSVAAYLIENNRTSELNSLGRDVMQLRADKDNTIELTAISAHSLEESQIKSIEHLVKKIYPKCQQVIVNQVQDESVIGGVRLEFANQLLDLSVSFKLNKLRQLTS